MEDDARPSTSQELPVDLTERSLLDDVFKGEFTNALLAANAIYEEQNLLTKNPPQKISSVSLAMAHEISKATINIINDCIISTEEELILFDESDNEGEFEEVCFIIFCTCISIIIVIPEKYKENINFDLCSAKMIQRLTRIILQKILKSHHMTIFH